MREHLYLEDDFPVAWKKARISTVPKTSEVKTNNELRPISILPVFSKLYERLVLRQKVDLLALLLGAF